MLRKGLAADASKADAADAPAELPTRPSLKNTQTMNYKR
jgi:hypothetical protein